MTMADNIRHLDNYDGRPLRNPVEGDTIILSLPTHRRSSSSK